MAKLKSPALKSAKTPAKSAWIGSGSTNMPAAATLATRQPKIKPPVKSGPPMKSKY